MTDALCGKRSQLSYADTPIITIGTEETCPSGTTPCSDNLQAGGQTYCVDKSTQ